LTLLHRGDLVGWRHGGKAATTRNLVPGCLFHLERTGGKRMATMMTQLGEREFFAAMAMQGILCREKLPADQVARQAVAYADALILAIDADAKVPRMELNVEAASPIDISR
jgi:hypothetical protein